MSNRARRFGVATRDPASGPPRSRVARCRTARAGSPVTPDPAGRTGGAGRGGVRAPARGRRRLLTLTGPGGIGKTRLGLEAARRLDAELPEGALLVTLDSLSIPRSWYRRFCVRSAARPTEPDPVESVGRMLGADPPLLVLDSFEHLLPAASSIARLLGSCTGLKLLVTSRETLRIGGERELRVPPLRVPDARASADELADNASYALFVDRAQAARPGLKIDDADQRRSPSCAGGWTAFRSRSSCRGPDSRILHPVALATASRTVSTWSEPATRRRGSGRSARRSTGATSSSTTTTRPSSPGSPSSSEASRSTRRLRSAPAPSPPCCATSSRWSTRACSSRRSPWNRDS